MTKILMFLAFLGLVSTTFLVAEEKPAEKGQGKGGLTVEQILEKWTTDLSLTKDQVPKIKVILEETKKNRDALKDVAPEERKEKFKAIMEEQATKVKPILTAEQLKGYEKMIEEMKSKMTKGQGEGKKKAE